MAANSREFTDSDWKKGKGEGAMAFPTHKGKRLSSAELTPTAVADIPPGRVLRSSPPRRGRGLWNPPNLEGKRSETSFPWTPKVSPLPVVGARAPPQEWVGSGNAIARRGSWPWQIPGSPPHPPCLPPEICTGIHLPRHFLSPPRYHILYHSPSMTPPSTLPPLWTSHWPTPSLWLDTHPLHHTLLWTWQPI